MTGKNNPFYGKKHSDETKKKVSQSRKGKCCGKENSKYVGFKINPFKEDIIQTYKEGYSTFHIAKKYGVSSTYIGSYLKKEGIKLRAAFYGFKGVITCEDGHKVRSVYETIIDNFLYKNKIKHFTNGLITKGKPYRYDFYLPINNVYVEYWGLIRFKEYSKRQIKKKRLYKKLNYKLLSIYPNDNINKKLNSELL